MRATWWVICLGLSFAVGSGCDDGADGDADADIDADVDGEVDADGDGAACDLPCGSACCDAGQVCVRDVCIEEASCAAGEPCQGDAFCEDGLCVPFGAPFPDFDNECTMTLRPGIFRSVVQCEWAGPPEGDAYPGYVQVVHTPLVVDFRTGRSPGEPSRPSIVFASASLGPSATGPGVIRIIDGATCEQVATLADPLPNGVSTPALGDLNDDGRPDIVAQVWGGGLAAWAWDDDLGQWQQLWHNSERVLTTFHALSLADLDDDGSPEILAGGLVYGADGVLRSSTIGEVDFPTPAWGHQVTTVADVDLDGQLEIVQGDSTWAWSAEAGDFVEEPYCDGPVPYSGTSVADFGDFAGVAGDAPGRPEVAVMMAEGFRVQTIAGEPVFGPYHVPGSGDRDIDQFSIGDVDGDGVPEISVPGRWYDDLSPSYVSVFDLDCVPGGGPGECASAMEDGSSWRQPVIVETGGTTTFDFEGDGRAEIVYADWCYVRVLDGRDGTTLWSHPRASGGYHEMPIIADVDGDYHAEIVSVSANDSYVANVCASYSIDPYYAGLRCEADEDCPSAESRCDSGLCRCSEAVHCADPALSCVDPLPGGSGEGRVCRSAWTPLNGVRVYSDAQDRWAGSRMIWNQHAYAVTNVNDDGTIPRGSEMQRNWEVSGLNNFRQNVQLQGHATDDSPDLTVGGLEAPACDSATRQQVLAASVCNRGTLPVAAGVQVSFRLDSPDGAELCATTTIGALHGGDCEDVECTWDGVPIEETHTVHAVVDPDDGDDVVECHEDNNDAADEVRCPPLLQ